MADTPRTDPDRQAPADDAEGVVPERDAERLKFFSDAVIAIAMTLLILPLMESANEIVGKHVTAGTWLQENGGRIAAFLISFAMIATNWVGHHATFLLVHRFTPRLLLTNLVWLLSIVTIPVTTALMTAAVGDRTNIALYVGNLLITALLGALLYWLVLSDRRVAPWSTTPMRQLAVGLATATALVVCYPIVVYTPVGGFGMFAMGLVSPIQSLYMRLLRRARAGRGRS